MEVRKGYKQTEVGIIPDDWKVHSLKDEIEQLEAGVSVNSINEHVSGHEQVILKTSSVNDGVFYPNEAKKILLKDIHRAKLNPRQNTIIISRMNTPELVGECGYVSKTWENHFIPDRLWMTKFKRNSEINVKWLSFILSYPSYKKNIKDIATGTSGSMKNISKTKLLEIKIPYPSPKEQTAIATALSDTDALISSLEKLIAKKRNIKQGAMQELLKPKKGWEVKRLGEICDVIGGGTPSTFNSNYWNGSIDWFTPTEVGSSKYVYKSQRKITKEGLYSCSARILPIDTILLTTRAGIGDLGILMVEACTNQGFQSLVTKKGIDNEFVYYLMSTLKNVLIQNASGSTFLEISPSKVKQIEINIPSTQEQNEIATILSEMDKEIDKLESKLEKYKQIKSGMMQNLLTGKIRLI